MDDMKRIAMGTDHAGYELKEILKSHLENQGYEVSDFGTDSSDQWITRTIYVLRPKASLLVKMTLVSFSAAAETERPLSPTRSPEYVAGFAGISIAPA